MIVVTAVIHLAPRAVQQLVVHHTDETSLSIRWKQPAGEWSSFTLLLSRVDDSGGTVTTVAQRDLTREAMDCTFNLLTPGLLYTVTVATNSGNLSSSASVTARTSTCDFNMMLTYLRLFGQSRTQTAYNENNWVAQSEIRDKIIKLA